MRRVTQDALWVPLGLFLVVVIVGCRPPRVVTAPLPAAEEYSVQISGDERGLTISPDTLTVYRGDIVRWTASIGEWEVFLGCDGPGRENVIAGDAGETGETVIRLTALPGEYKYTVAVRVGERLVRVDPEIIIANGDE